MSVDMQTHRQIIILYKYNQRARAEALVFMVDNN